MKRLLQRAADQLQELRELGPSGVAFRLAWELRQRSGFEALRYRASLQFERREEKDSLRVKEGGLPFAEAGRMAEFLRLRISDQGAERLVSLAEDALRGRILCFGRWSADYGSPIDWHLNPVSGQHWAADRHASRVLAEAGRVGDVKLTWEVGRFPHAFFLARAAALQPRRAEAWAVALLAQFCAFLDQSPEELGVHWVSGQEITFRLFTLLFAHQTLFARSPVREEASVLLASALAAGAAHIARNIGYARFAVHNNHLLSEAAGLLMAGLVLPDHHSAESWKATGRQLLQLQIPRQFYPDGGYIQQSHNYHRLALQVLLLTRQLLVTAGAEPLADLDDALERSVDFLTALQNPADGRLPNYGANDGALPLVLSTCDYSDFRPTLQAASIAARGTRLYPEGPWDEEAAWLLGPEAIDAHLENRRPVSRTFDFSSHQVLRGIEPGSFGAFRCGTLRDRFSQIDMLHLDVWWRGQNVLVDGGSYLYNGPAKWHEHFMRTASHNTLTVDGQDQMVHHRKFKVLYWTRAKRLAFRDNPTFALVAGEHLGYQRKLGCVHRRSVLFLKDDLWVVADTLLGTGAHLARLHWLGAPCAYAALADGSGIRLDTPAGPFFVRAFSQAGESLAGDVVAGREEPPRGWLSRYYGEKIPAPSFAVEQKVTLPWTCISILSSGQETELQRIEGTHTGYRVLGSGCLVFNLKEGFFEDIEIS